MAFEDAVQQRTYVLEKRFDDDFHNSGFPTYAECDAVANAAIDKIIAETIEIAVRGNLRPPSSDASRTRTAVCGRPQLIRLSPRKEAPE